MLLDVQGQSSASQMHHMSTGLHLVAPPDLGNAPAFAQGRGRKGGTIGGGRNVWWNGLLLVLPLSLSFSLSLSFFLFLSPP